jgi:hypothetical protein
MADLAQRSAVAIERATLALLDANRQLAELVIANRTRDRDAAAGH